MQTQTMPAAAFQAMQRQAKPKQGRNQAESKLQVICVRWFRQRYPEHVLLSNLNGAKLSGDGLARARQWARLEAEGAMAGAADLQLVLASGDFNGLFIEMKTEKGRQSESQKVFEAKVLAGGYGYVIPRSLEEFQRVIQSYLENGTY